MTSRSDLHPRLAEIVDTLANTRQHVVTYAKSLDDQRLAFKSAPDRWSALDNLEHLGAVEDSVGKLFGRLTAQLVEAGSPQETESSSILDCVDHFAFSVVTQRIQAPERLHPTGQLTLDAALERLEVSRTRLLDAIERANGLALEQITFPHPVLGPIHGYAWLIFLSHHELRHLSQMRENLAHFASDHPADHSA